MIDQIKEVMEKTLSIEIPELSRETKLSSLDIDSLDMVELVMELEEKFNVSINIENESIETIGELIDIIKK